MVKCRVTTESQPEAFVNVWVGAISGVWVKCSPYQSNSLQAKAVVSPVLECPMVRCSVTTLSQPEALVNVCVGLTIGVSVKCSPYQSNSLQAKAVVSPVNWNRSCR